MSPDLLLLDEQYYKFLFNKTNSNYNKFDKNISL